MHITFICGRLLLWTLKFLVALALYFGFQFYQFLFSYGVEICDHSTFSFKYPGALNHWLLIN